MHNVNTTRDSVWHCSSPVGVPIVAAHFREDLCLQAGNAIEARGTPPSPIDPMT
jgi:amidase